MRFSVKPSELEALGLSPDSAKALARRVNAARAQQPDRMSAPAQVRLWLAFRRALDATPSAGFPVHRFLYRLAYEGRRPGAMPAPAWIPSRDDLQTSHIAQTIRANRLRSYAALHRWSINRREQFWSDVIRRLGIVFRTAPTEILPRDSKPSRPDWLKGARMNIAESALRPLGRKPAILAASEDSPAIRRLSYAELRELASRVANGLEALGTKKGDRIALYLPMTPESVAIYLGVILAGRCVVGIADASAAADFAKRVRIPDARLVFTIDAYRRDGKDHGIYEKVVEADGPRAVVLGAPQGSGDRARG